MGVWVFRSLSLLAFVFSFQTSFANSPQSSAMNLVIMLLLLEIRPLKDNTRLLLTSITVRLLSISNPFFLYVQFSMSTTGCFAILMLHVQRTHLLGFVVFLTFLWWEGKCLHNTDSPHLHLSKIPRRPNTLFVLVHVCQFECSREGEQFRWGEGDREEGQRVSVANLSAAACDPCGLFFTWFTGFCTVTFPNNRPASTCKQWATEQMCKIWHTLPSECYEMIKTEIIWTQQV